MKTKNRARLAFEMLEKEFETLSSEGMNSMVGGDGTVTSGTGTKDDPYVISTSAVINQSSFGANYQDALNGISDINSQDAVRFRGSYYKVQIDVVASGGDITISGTENGHGVHSGSSAGSLGGEKNNDVRIYTSKINNTSGYSHSEMITAGIRHEVGHSLGMDHGDGLAMRQYSGSTGANGEPQDINGVPGDYNRTSIKAMLDSGRVNWGTGVPHSTGTDADDGIYDQDPSTPSMIISTGIDDIGYYQIISTADSSGNSITVFTHPYGYEFSSGYGNYFTSGFSPSENWNNKVALLSSGYDEFGISYNFSYNDEYGNISTGYYHSDFHPESTGI